MIVPGPSWHASAASCWVAQTCFVLSKKKQMQKLTSLIVAVVVSRGLGPGSREALVLGSACMEEVVAEAAHGGHLLLGHPVRVGLALVLLELGAYHRPERVALGATAADALGQAQAVSVELKGGALHPCGRARARERICVFVSLYLVALLCNY